MRAVVNCIINILLCFSTVIIQTSSDYYAESSVGWRCGSFLAVIFTQDNKIDSHNGQFNSVI